MARAFLLSCLLASTLSCGGSPSVTTSATGSANIADTPVAQLPGDEAKAGPAWRWENPLPQGSPLTAIWGNPAGELYAVGFEGTILHSPDGGRSFE